MALESRPASMLARHSLSVPALCSPLISEDRTNPGQKFGICRELLHRLCELFHGFHGAHADQAAPQHCDPFQQVGIENFFLAARA